MLDTLLEGALTTVLHEDVEIIFASAFDRYDLNKVRMFAECMNDLDLPVNCSFIVLIAMIGNDFDSKFLIRIGLVIGFHDGTKIASAKLFTEEYGIGLKFIVDIKTSEPFLDGLFFHFICGR